MRKKIFLVLFLFAVSALGGALIAIVFQSKEAVAGCAALTGKTVYWCTCKDNVYRNKITAENVDGKQCEDNTKKNWTCVYYGQLLP